MRIKSISMVDGMWRGGYDIGNIAVVYNPLNEQGKTTFLRCILYALGYPVPSTLGLKFDRVEFTITVDKDNGEVCIIKRIGNVVEMSVGLTTKTYLLPSGQNEMHKDLFGLSSDLLVENLLGAYYFDQEKGWIVLNRGKVIGGIHFTIEDFLRGLSDHPCLQEYKKLHAVEREIKKYKQMLEIAQYQASNRANGEDVPFEAPSEEIQRELNRLYNERRPIDGELSRVESVIRKNTTFKRYVASMHLRVRGRDGLLVPVNEDTIEDFKMNEAFLNAKREDLKVQISVIENKIAALEKRLDKETLLVDVESDIQHFDAAISRIQIDKDAVEGMLKELKKQRQRLKDVIHTSIAMGSTVVESLSKSICSYLKEFGIDERHGYDIFTHDIKSLTGAFYHMLIFAFRISYAKLVRERTGLALPVIVDSPHGREVEQEKVNKMLSVLARDFSEHQIIIATIYNPQISGQHVININNGVMHLLGEVE